MIKTIVIVLFTFLTLHVVAQDKYIGRKSIFLEAGGFAGYGSLNYESIFAKSRRAVYAARIGAGAFQVEGSSELFISVPVGLDFIYGMETHRLDLSIGHNFAKGTQTGFYPQAVAGVGYRHQAKDNPFFFRIAYTPRVSYLDGVEVQHWAGLTLGLTFNLDKCDTCPSFH